MEEIPTQKKMELSPKCLEELRVIEQDIKDAEGGLKVDEEALQYTLKHLADSQTRLKERQKALEVFKLEHAKYNL